MVLAELILLKLRTNQENIVYQKAILNDNNSLSKVWYLTKQIEDIFQIQLQLSSNLIGENFTNIAFIDEAYSTALDKDWICSRSNHIFFMKFHLIVQLQLNLAKVLMKNYLNFNCQVD